jgi:hypothetical protein
MRVKNLKMDKMDRRVHDRTKVQLSCSLTTPGDNPGPIVGVTENISRGGVLIRWTAQPDTIPLPNSGTYLAVAVKLPLGPRYLRCSGRVVRVSTARDGPNLVAVEIRRISFSGETEVFAPESVAAYSVN